MPMPKELIYLLDIGDSLRIEDVNSVSKTSLSTRFDAHCFVCYQKEPDFYLEISEKIQKDIQDWAKKNDADWAMSYPLLHLCEEDFFTLLKSSRTWQTAVTVRSILR